MAFNTPTFDYSRATNNLTTDKGLQDNAQDYGRFLSQERFRRGLGDADRQFKDRFPKVGQGFQNRGMYNSGLRKEGQNKFAGDYQRNVNNARFDFGAQEFGQEQSNTDRQAGYQRALLSLFEQLQQARGAGFDPFAGIKSQIGGS